MFVQMRGAVVAIPVRRAYLERAILPHVPADTRVFYDDPDKPLYCWGNHLRAMQEIYAENQALAPQHRATHYVGFEDDVGVPSTSWHNLAQVIEARPDDMILPVFCNWNYRKASRLVRRLMFPSGNGLHAIKTFPILPDIPHLEFATRSIAAFAIPMDWIPDIVEWDRQPEVREIQRQYRQIREWLCNFKPSPDRHAADIFMYMYCIHRAKLRWVCPISLFDDMGGSLVTGGRPGKQRVFRLLSKPFVNVMQPPMGSSPVELRMVSERTAKRLDRVFFTDRVIERADALYHEAGLVTVGEPDFTSVHLQELPVRLGDGEE